MALKPIDCPDVVPPLAERVLALAKSLGAGQCYVVKDVAVEFGVSHIGVVAAARKVGVYALRCNVRGPRPCGVIVNPKYAKEAKA